MEEWGDVIEDEYGVIYESDDYIIYRKKGQE